MTEQIEAVQRMQKYIELHLNETITPAELATAAMFSPWHSYRLFRQFTGYTPADYIRRLRLSKSALRLRDESCRIIDVAYDMGFGSTDGYQRAFLREFGCNPREYAASPVPLPLFTPFGVKFKELWKESCNMEAIKNIFIRTEDRPERKIIIKRGKKAESYWDYCNEVGCDVWGILTSIKSLCNEPVCMWLPEKYRAAGTSRYVQGAEVSPDYDGAVPEGFDIITLPAAKYLVFQGEPFEEESYCEAIEEVWAAMKKYDPSILGMCWDDDNPRIQLEPVGARGYIEMRAIKPASGQS